MKAARSAFVAAELDGAGCGDVGWCIVSVRLSTTAQ
jgi:hypothetical protein